MFKKDDAVSPVIGVILMVAITVILAAVIAAFVFGMTGSVQTTKNVAFVATLSGTNSIVITNHGGVDVDQLTGLTIKGVTGAVYNDLSKVGTSKKYSLDLTVDQPRRVIITGTFIDGGTSILFDRQF